MCENFSFKKIRTILINLIQLHHFYDVINEFNLTDLYDGPEGSLFIHIFGYFSAV